MDDLISYRYTYEAFRLLLFFIEILLKLKLVCFYRIHNPVASSPIDIWLCIYATSY